ncbi:MAG: hypothetical protein P9M13_03450 [Candidatus Ancaeobacter aquaticus]|nr:hypothetical protein [Candidatus Ancaeobacter aquaticus]
MRYAILRMKQIIKELGIPGSFMYALQYIVSRMLNTIEEIKSSVIGHALSDGLISYIEYRILKKQYPSYYKGRWRYIKYVLGIISEVNPESVLELGPHHIPLVKGSDTMNIDDCHIKPTFMHDARITPWPVEDNAYDMFIALQVWEHLGDKQAEAFQEVMRIARSAILSFPYKRCCPRNCHHNVDEKIISKWTCHKKPEKIINTGLEIIYFFTF